MVTTHSVGSVTTHRCSKVHHRLLTGAEVVVELTCNLAAPVPHNETNSAELSAAAPYMLYIMYRTFVTVIALGPVGRSGSHFNTE